VLVRIHVRARGAGSGIEIAAGGWNVWTLSDDGLMTRVEVFSGHQEAEALEAAGAVGVGDVVDNVEVVRRVYN
jgi:hypothetical protein